MQFSYLLASLTFAHLGSTTLLMLYQDGSCEVHKRNTAACGRTYLSSSTTTRGARILYEGQDARLYENGDCSGRYSLLNYRTDDCLGGKIARDLNGGNVGCVEIIC